MKIFRVSRKSALTFGDICLSSGRACLRCMRHIRFYFPLSVVAVFLALAVVCCARFVFKPLPHSSTPLFKTIFSSSETVVVFSLSAERAETFIRMKSGLNQELERIIFGLLGQFSTVLSLKSRNIYHNLICGQLFYTFNSYYFS